MSFEFDPSKAKSNLRKHGVSFAHAEQALRDPMALKTRMHEASSASSRWALTHWVECLWSFTLCAKSGRA